MPECTCRIVGDWIPGSEEPLRIRKCAFCKAAPALYEACQAAAMACSRPSRLCEQLNAAMFAAKE